MYINNRQMEIMGSFSYTENAYPCNWKHKEKGEGGEGRREREGERQNKNYNFPF